MGNSSALPAVPALFFAEDRVGAEVAADTTSKVSQWVTWSRATNGRMQRSGTRGSRGVAGRVTHRVLNHGKRLRNPKLLKFEVVDVDPISRLDFPLFIGTVEDVVLEGEKFSHLAFGKEMFVLV